MLSYDRDGALDKPLPELPIANYSLWESDEWNTSNQPSSLHMDDSKGSGDCEGMDHSRQRMRKSHPQPFSSHHQSLQTINQAHYAHRFGSIVSGKFVVHRAMSMNMTRQDIIKFLNSMPNLHMLFWAASHSQFKDEYQAQKLHLVRSTLRKSRPVEWELREMGISHTMSGEAVVPLSEIYYQQLARPYPDRPVCWSAKTYLNHYAHEMYVCARITALILCRCQVSEYLDKERLDALRQCTSPRGGDMHRAIWRTWSFCRLFGMAKGREDDIIAQQRWLSGHSTQLHMKATTGPGGFSSQLVDLPPHTFASGNLNGLSVLEICDMISVWKCLRRLFLDQICLTPIPVDWSWESEYRGRLGLNSSEDHPLKVDCIR